MKILKVGDDCVQLNLNRENYIYRIIIVDIIHHYYECVVIYPPTFTRVPLLMTDVRKATEGDVMKWMMEQ